MFGVTVHTSGPVFDGRAAHLTQEAAEESNRRIAQQGAFTVRQMLDRVLKRQTPYYRLQVEAHQDPPGWAIDDGGVVYGPWLEGVGSRNFPVTAFKGYATFRRAVQIIQGRAKDTAEHVFGLYVGRM